MCLELVTGERQWCWLTQPAAFLCLSLLLHWIKLYGGELRTKPCRERASVWLAWVLNNIQSKKTPTLRNEDMESETWKDEESVEYGSLKSLTLNIDTRHTERILILGPFKLCVKSEAHNLIGSQTWVVDHFCVELTRHVTLLGRKKQNKTNKWHFYLLVSKKEMKVWGQTWCVSQRLAMLLWLMGESIVFGAEGAKGSLLLNTRVCISSILTCFLSLFDRIDECWRLRTLLLV